MKLTSSGLDELNRNLTPADVSTVSQNSNDTDKSKEPDSPGIPSTDTTQYVVNNHNKNTSTNDPICLNATSPHAKIRELQFSSKGLHLCNLNIQHILPKLNELRVVMAKNNGPDIFCACETFLEPNMSNNQIAIDGYVIHRKDRAATQNKNGGGLVLYCRNSLTCSRRSDLEISSLETIWAEIELPNARPFLVCTAYRPPNALSEWIDLFEEELSIAQATGLEYIVMGDFNIDLHTCTNTKWLNMIQLFDLYQLITESTRITPTTSTLIDHVYTTAQANITESFVSDLSISDHLPVCVTRRVSSKISKKEHISASYRSFKHFDEDLFLQELTTDLETFHPHHLNVDDDFVLWFSLILKHLDIHAPIKTKRVKTKRLPYWFTPEIAEIQKRRDTSKRLKRWDDYRKFRNKTRQLIKQAKRKYFSESVNNCKDTKAIWKHLRAVTTGSKSSPSNLPSEIIINNERITGSENIASTLNKYFASVAEQFQDNNSNVSNSDHDKIRHFVNSKVPSNTSFNIPFITNEQVSTYIKRLDSSKATGLDGLGPRLLKLAVNCLSSSIAALINKSLATGQFPSQLKQAKIFPIFKGGTKTDPSNYRPISILPTISKIFERHVNKHLMGYLNKHNLINKNQSGFRAKHSCQTALIKLIDKWMECIDKGDIVGTLFLDFRKAFDLVDHKILMDKLSLCHFSPSALRWFDSYLDGRHQAILSETGLTEFANIRYGVPQGSILGPTLFLIFINDLPLNFDFCLSDFYADDGTVHTHDKNVETVEIKLQGDLNNAKHWSEENKLPLNYNKTTCMTIGTKKRINDSRKLNLEVDEVCIQNMSTQKLLGVHLDQYLTWSANIDNLCSAISSKISLLRQLAEYVPICVQKRFYQGYILPLIDYGSITWGTTSIANIQRLSKLQKRAARIILKANFDTPSSLMFQELGLLSVENRLKYNKAVITYRALNNLTPDYLSELLTPLSEIHSLNLRSSENGLLHIPLSRTTIFDNSFTCSAPKLWNALPQTVRASGSLVTFKKNLKHCLNS